MRRSLTTVLMLGTVMPAAAQQPAWPPPPETPRIQYVTSLRSEADFGKKESFLGRMMRNLSGSASAMYAIQRPFDLYTRTGDQLFVSDGMSAGLFVFDRQAKEARVLGKDVPGGLVRPMGLGGDGTGRVYIADAGTGRVIVLAADGRFERAFGGREVLYNPVDVAVDSAAGRVYVVDSYQHQVIVFNATGTVVGRLGRQGQSLAERLAELAAQPAPTPSPASPHGSGNGAGAAEGHEAAGVHATSRDVWANRGAEPGEFRYPVAVAVARDGTVYVSDQMNFRVQAFDRRGAHLRTIGQAGTTPGSFSRPKGVAVDSEGHLYVADAAFNNIQVFDPDGRLLLAFGTLGHEPGEHWMPLGLHFDRTDRLYVADRYNHRAAVYQYLQAPAAGSPEAGR